MIKRELNSVKRVIGQAKGRIIYISTVTAAPESTADVLFSIIPSFLAFTVAHDTRKSPVFDAAHECEQLAFFVTPPKSHENRDYACDDQEGAEVCRRSTLQ